MDVNVHAPSRDDEARPRSARLPRLALAVAAAFWLLESALHALGDGGVRFELWPRDLNELWMRSLIAALIVGFGLYAQRELRRRERLEEDRIALRAQLERALTSVLGSFLPICASCKSIRDDEGNWSHIETYIGERTHTEFSHGICPPCAERLYPEHSSKG